MRLELEMVPIIIISITIVDDNMSVEGWFDELGKDRMSLTASNEDAGF